MGRREKIGIQGYEGSFHEEAAIQFFGNEIDTVSYDTFSELALTLESGQIDGALMAIENSIAGTILQNYRLLREHHCHIIGEVYLRIRHQLMVNDENSIDDVKKVISHPMALNQCLHFLRSYPKWRLVESEDTALSAIRLKQSPKSDVAVIASNRAAQFHDLKIIARNIETNTTNYTRFFVLRKAKYMVNNSNKASIYLQIEDQKGRLLSFLKLVDQCDINLSKLQSFPVEGNFRAYYFHIDLEFEGLDQYQKLKELCEKQDFKIEELGVYQRADIDFLKKLL